MGVGDFVGVLVNVGVKVWEGVGVSVGVSVSVGINVSVGVSVIVLVKIIVGVNVSVIVAVKIVAVFVEDSEVAVSLYPGFDVSMTAITIKTTQLTKKNPTIITIGIIHFFDFFVGTLFVPIDHSFSKQPIIRPICQSSLISKVDDLNKLYHTNC